MREFLLERQLADKKQRGYADFFDWPDKCQKEAGIMDEFVKGLERDGLKIESGKQHPGGQNHAPDFQLITRLHGTWGIEITELVSQCAIEETKNGTPVFAGWTDDELISGFHTLVNRKDNPENVRGGPYDRYILLVHVDEMMLAADRIAKVIGTSNFTTHLIDDIYVLLSYDPHTQMYPLLNFKPDQRTCRAA
jgi:hypothetical protein